MIVGAPSTPLPLPPPPPQKKKKKKKEKKNAAKFEILSCRVVCSDHPFVLPDKWLPKH